MSICALSFSLSHEKIRQKYQLVPKWRLFMWFWPKHALIWNWPHIPQNLWKLQNLIFIVFYIYPAFQNAINHLLIIYGSKVEDKSVEVVTIRVCTLSCNIQRTITRAITCKMKEFPRCFYHLHILLFIIQNNIYVKQRLALSLCFCVVFILYSPPNV